ncbi:MAG: SDR family oxidoreductase [Deltaproteobacteria bacterium]|nr:SDR family oxidoreductase [Deltaproteobacteria bacterium]
MNVCIVGCGYVGSTLATLLLEQGACVFGLRRRVDHLPIGVEPLAIDIFHAEALRRGLPEALDALVFAAAVGRGADQGDYKRLYVDGLRHVIAALEARGQRPRLLFTSSTGVYGQDDHRWVDERSPTEPASFSGRCMVEAERLLSACSLETCAVRFGGIYGPDRTFLLRQVAQGQAKRSDVLHYTNRIHRDDCAAVLSHLLNQRTLAPCYVAVDDQPAPHNDVLCYLAELLGVAAPEVGPRAQRTRGGSKRCNNRLLRESGYQLIYPSYREGYRALVSADVPKTRPSDVD